MSLPTPTGRPPRILVAVGLAVAALAAVGVYRPIDDPDLYAHLKAGEDILADHAVATADRYSYTFANRPLALMDWAAEAVMALLHRGFGEQGLFALAAVLAAGATFVLALRMRAQVAPHSPTLAAILLMLAYAASAFRMTPRPQTFAWVCLGLLLWLFEHAAKQHSLRPLWWVPLLCVVWSNLHSSSILVLPFLAVFALAQLFDAHIRKRVVPPPRLRSLVLLGLASLAAYFAAPNPAGRLHSTIENFFSPYFTQVIGEWHAPIFQVWLGPAGVLSGLVLASFLLDRHRTEAHEVMLFALALWLGARNARLLPVLAIVGAPMAYQHLTSFLARIAANDASPSRWRRGLARIDPWLATLLLIAAVVAGQGFDWHSPWLGGAGRPRARLEGAAYPVGATNFLARERPQGHMYNTYHFGGYLLYRLGPQTQVYVDGRVCNLYDEAHMREVMAIRHDWRRTFARWDVQYTINQHNEMEVELAADPRWSLVYFDDAALVFVRNDGPNAALANRLRYELIVPPFNKEPVGSEQRVRAQTETERLVREAPTSSLAHILRGRMRALQGDLAGFESDMRTASTLNPARPEPLIRLGLLALSRGRAGEAEQALARAVALNPEQSALRVQLAAAQLAKPDRAAAQRTLQPLVKDGRSLEELLSAAARYLPASPVAPGPIVSP